MTIRYGTYRLPHLSYIVRVKPFPANRPDDVAPTVHAYVRWVDRRTSDVFLWSRTTPPDLAHELVHVLQNVCESYRLDFIAEREHVAYMMGYLMGEILGYAVKGVAR